MAGLLHGECITCTGKTVAENLAAVPTVDEVNRSLPTPQQVLFSVARPFKPAGNHILVLHGNLAPESAVCKLSGKVRGRVRTLTLTLTLTPNPTPTPAQENVYHRGPARCFDEEHQAYEAILAGGRR